MNTRNIPSIKGFAQAILFLLLSCADATDKSDTTILESNIALAKQWSVSERVNAMQAVVAIAESKGYTAQNGKFDFFAIEDCRYLQNCYGNNPSSPYGLSYFPALESEDESHVSSADELTAAINGEIARASIKFDDSDALIWLGRMPTNVRYFGLTPYLYLRNKKPESADGQWSNLFASLSDTLNHVVLKDSLQSDIFDRELAFVFAYDQQSLEDAIEALLDTGLDRSEIFQIAMPDLYQFGTGKDADVFVPLMRVAFFESEQAQAEYLNSAPFEVLRIRKNRGSVRPVSVPELRTYPLIDEASMNEALELLKDAIESKYQDRLLGSTASLELALEGHSCIADQSGCLGDNRDSPYYTNFGALLPDDDSFSVAIGVNHHAFGSAEYSAVSFYYTERLMGVAAIGDQDLEGSASQYLPDHPDQDLLFAVHYARNCANIPEPCVTIPVEFPGIPLDTRVTVAERAYVAPGYAVGPNPNGIVPLRTIHVGGR